MTLSIVPNNGNGDSDRSPFDAIRGYKENGMEYWTARELMKWLGYTRWEQGEIALNRAIKSIKNQGHDITENVREVLKLVSRPSRGNTEIVDYELSRFACYVAAMNADPEKEMVALAQGYFAKQTYKQELLDAPKETTTQTLLIEQSKIVAQCIDDIQNLLAKSNPRLAQILIDIGVNDFVESHQPKLAGNNQEFPEDRWYGLVQIAKKMGISTNLSTRVKLGNYISAKHSFERVREERLCNGQYESIWCYRDNDETRAAIQKWNDDGQNSK